jgi:hypothetical protein
MRNFVKFLGIIALVAIIGFTMTACGGGGGGGNLNGTYSDEYGMATYTFSDGKISMKSMGMTLSGTFQIKGKNIIATFNGLDKPETIKYTLQGDTLTLEMDGDTTVLTRKKE